MKKVRLEGQLLKIGDIATSGNAHYRVVEFLGAGGQGEVYRVEMGGASYALKWYFDPKPAQRDVLNELLKLGSPHPRFLWPQALVTVPTREGFGYTMGLRPKEYHELTEILKRTITPTFSALCTSAVQMADSFLHLHAKGLAYRDISLGNVFIKPDSGDILICDNDNADIQNSPRPIGVGGTPRFMAPEVVTGDSKPDVATDLWSLAVLFFYMFVLHHPLEGKKESEIHCLDPAAHRRLFGTHPVFIFDPKDPSNRPDPEFHANPQLIWPVLPKFFQRMFLQSFTSGIRDRSKRYRESMWRNVMIQLKDSIVLGPQGTQNFFDPERMSSVGAIYDWKTGQPCEIPLRLLLPDHSFVLLREGAVLTKHHIDPRSSGNISDVVAEVVRHPSQPGRFGLKNLSQAGWAAKGASKEHKTVDPGKSLVISEGAEVTFAVGLCKIIR